MIEAVGNLTGNINSSQSLVGNINKAIEYIAPSTQEKTVTPTIEEQRVLPDEGIFALSKVTVEAVDNTIDSNIQAGNIKDGVSILGVDGDYQGDTSDATAIQSDIASGKTAYISTGKVTGTAPDYWDLTKKNSGVCYTYIREVPTIDLSGYININALFAYMSRLEKIPLLDGSGLTTITNSFVYCSSLVDFLGLQNIGEAFLTTRSANYASYVFNLNASNELSHDSLVSIINNLYDIATKGVQPQQLVIGARNISKLTAVEIAIATNKGWTVV